MIFSPRQARDGHRTIGKVETQKEGLSWFCRDLAPFGQRYRDVPLERCFAELHVEASLEARCASVEAFNARTRWQKRGLAVVPTVRHVSLGKAWDNQGLALLNLYTDGCVPKNAFLAHGFHYKETIGLPRQARDKRRKKLNKRYVFLREMAALFPDEVCGNSHPLFFPLRSHYLCVSPEPVLAKYRSFLYILLRTQRRRNGRRVWFSFSCVCVCVQVFNIGADEVTKRSS